MKNINYLVVFIGLCLAGCSNNSGSTPTEFIHNRTLSFFVNDVEKFHASEDTYAFRKEHMITIGGENVISNIGPSYQVSFDENGRFGKIIYKQQTPGQPDKYFYSHRNYSSHYLTFALESFDAINMQVKGSFSGYIFTNPEDLSSESKFVSGSFDLPVADLVPPVSGLTNEADINGQFWRSTNRFQTQGDNTGFAYEVNIHCLRDDDYRMTLTFDKYNTTAVNYNFTSSTQINKIKIEKYDLNTSSYINYNCTGMVQVLIKNQYFFDGTYSFTAVNPNNASDVIQVQNGKFRLNYNPY